VFLARYCWGDQVEKDEMGMVCDMYGRDCKFM